MKLKMGKDKKGGGDKDKNKEKKGKEKVKDQGEIIIKPNTNIEQRKINLYKHKKSNGNNRNNNNDNEHKQLTFKPKPVATTEEIPSIFILLGSYEKCVLGYRLSNEFRMQEQKLLRNRNDENEGEEDGMVDGKEKEEEEEEEQEQKETTKNQQASTTDIVNEEENVIEVVFFEPAFYYLAHIGYIKTVKISGNLAVSAGTDELIKIYNVKKCVELGSVREQAGDINAISFFKNTHMFSASSDCTISIWKVKEWECLKTMRGHKAAVLDLDIHPSGKLALSVGKDNTLHLWNLLTGKSGHTLHFKSTPDLVRWDPLGNLYIVGFGKKVDVFSLEGELKHTLEHTKTIQAAAFLTPHILATGGEEGLINIWDVKTGKLLTILEAVTSRVKSLSYCPIVPEVTDFSSLPLLISAHSNGLLIVWDVERALIVGKFSTEARITCMSVSIVGGHDRDRTALLNLQTQRMAEFAGEQEQSTKNKKDKKGKKSAGPEIKGEDEDNTREEKEEKSKQDKKRKGEGEKQGEKDTPIKIEEDEEEEEKSSQEPKKDRKPKKKENKPDTQNQDNVVIKIEEDGSDFNILEENNKTTTTTLRGSKDWGRKKMTEKVKVKMEKKKDGNKKGSDKKDSKEVEEIKSETEELSISNNNNDNSHSHSKQKLLGEKRKATTTNEKNETRKRNFVVIKKKKTTIIKQQ